MVLQGEAAGVLTQRYDTMTRAYAHHPERCVGGAPTRRALPAVVTINPTAEDQAAAVAVQ